MDIAAAVQTFTADTERSADLDRRDREYGGLVPSDRLRDDIAAAVAAWVPPYHPETTLAEVRQACADDWRDWREIKTTRLMFDVSRATRRYCRAFSKADQDVIANGAALLLLRWPSNGGGIGDDGKRTPIFDLGGIRAERETLRAAQRGDAPRTARAARLAGARMSQLDWIDRAERLLSVGTLPLRRDWLDDNRQLSPLARRALQAAIKQAADETRAPSDKSEITTDPIDIALLIDEESSASGEISRLPDGIAPELISRYLDISLDAARLIVARAFPHASPTDLAAQWQISAQSLANAMQRGAATLHARYPDASTLLSALASVGPSYRTDCERGAIMALIDYRDAFTDESIARGAVAEWRESTVSMGDVERALLAAARRAIKRTGGTYGSERAERVAGTVARLLSAEMSAARRMPNVTTSAPHKAGTQDWCTGYGTHRARRETVAERRALYALCAADESSAQGLISRIADTAHRVTAPEPMARPSASRLPRSGALDKCARSAQRAERKHLEPAVAQRVAAARERVRHLIESGSSNADEIKSLRADIAAAVGA